MVYKNNIVKLPPEIETTVYCINTGEYVSEDVIYDNNSISLETLYKDEEQKGFIYGDCVVIEGEYDYEEMAVTEVNRVLVSVMVYGQDKESVRNVVTKILDAYN